MKHIPPKFYEAFDHIVFLERILKARQNAATCNGQNATCNGTGHLEGSVASADNDASSFLGAALGRQGTTPQQRLSVALLPCKLYVAAPAADVAS